MPEEPRSVSASVIQGADPDELFVNCLSLGMNPTNVLVVSDALYWVKTLRIGTQEKEYPILGLYKLGMALGGGQFQGVMVQYEGELVGIWRDPGGDLGLRICCFKVDLSTKTVLDMSAGEAVAGTGGEA